MIKKIEIYNEQDPFNSNFVELDVNEKDKIHCNEEYVEDAYAMYANYFGDKKLDYDTAIQGITKATVSKVSGDTAHIDINEKYSTVIDLTKEKKEYLQFIQEDSVIDLKVQKKKDQYSASFSDAVHDIKRNEIVTSIGEQVAYKAKVKELIYGGYYLTIDGIDVFMPGSLAGMNKIVNFEALINLEMYVMPINFSKNYNMVVVSHREYLKTLKPKEIEVAKYDKEYAGKVTGASKFGIFAEFNTENDKTQPMVLTGLIPISEMDDATVERFNAREFKPGDAIDFFIKNIVNENKIILTKFYTDWEKVFKDYNASKEVNCKVVKKQGNIIFGVIDDTKLIGTITNYDKDCDIGDIIRLKISKVDVNNKKIFFKSF